MKSVNVTAVYPNYQNVAPSWRTHFWQIVVRIDTDAGVSGYGYGGGGRAAVEIVNRHLSELVVGSEIDSVDDIAKLWDELYFQTIPYGRKGVAIMAISGVDLALWDLLGNAEGQPVYKLIGPRHKDNIRAYATGIDTEWYAEMGFTAHKFPHKWKSKKDYEVAIRRSEKARRLMGPDALIMIDTYMSWNRETTIQMASNLRDYNIYWFEDILTPDDLVGQSELRDMVNPILISGGEHEFTHYGFQNLAQSEALDLWQPDITWCGGITAGLRILEIAQEKGIPVVPHRGGEVWGLHLITSSMCDDLAEVLPGSQGAQKDNLWLGEPTARDGLICPTDDPGFGVTINEEMLP